MKKTKSIKTRKLRAYGATLFCLISFILWLVFLCQDFLTKSDWGKIIHDIVWAGISGIVTFCCFYDAKTIGTSNEINDDERDDYIEMKTGNSMFNISQNLILILGVIALVWSLVLSKQVGISDSLVMTLMIIAVTLLVIWNSLILIWLVVTFINYRRN